MLDQAWEALKGLDWGSDLAPLTAIDQAIDRAHGDSAAQAELEEKLVGLLSQTTHAGRDYICRRLVTVGSERCVAAVAGLLSDAKTCHQARLTLEQLSVPAAVTALRTAAQSASGAAQIGLLGSLAKLGDPAATELFVAAAMAQDPELRAAGVWCLGQIGGPPAVEALAALPPTDPPAQMAITDALLCCADRLLAAGDKTAARDLYRKFTGENQPQHVRLAANKGILAAVRG
jgi:HEAT repeat protein